MDNYNKPVQVRWSDLDPNFHVRHSVYYDWGAFCRVSFLNEYGLTAEEMQHLHIGPILFREECIFRKEIRSGDVVDIGLEITKSRKDFSRWSIQHRLIKNGDTLAAMITVDGAWINVQQRKLASPPELVHKVFSNMPRSESFEWLV
ncbi:MAG: acyl-CoA thioesterase [Chitinophagaceae bacterium]